MFIKRRSIFDKDLNNQTINLTIDFSGWNIVDITPISGSLNIINGQGANSYMTYTIGIEVFMTK